MSLAPPQHTNGKQEAVTIARHQAVAGVAIGIIVIDIWYPLLPGNVANASTYQFPVIHHILRDATIKQVLSGDPSLRNLIVDAGKVLIEKYGVRAIVGACGSFANYQQEVAEALDVPVFMSVMLQVPLILSSLRKDQKLGILAASELALTPNVFNQCAIHDPDRLVIIGARTLPEFQNIMQCRGEFNNYRLQREVVSLIHSAVNSNPDIGAVLIQCSDLPPYAQAIQSATGLPVFDMNGLIEWVYHAVVRRPYEGFM